MNNILQTLNILHFLNDGFRSSFPSLLPFIAKAFHLNFTQVGLLGAAQGTLLLVLSVPIGLIISKIGGMKLLFISLFLYSFCAFGISIAASFAALVFFFYFAAAAFAPFHISGNSITARVAPKGKTGSIMGTFSVAGDLGRIALPTAALFIITFLGWRYTFLTLAFLGIFACGFLLFMLRDKKSIFQNINTSDTTEDAKDWLIKMIKILHEKPLLLILLAGTLDGFGGSAIFVYLPFLLLAKGIQASFLAFYMASYFLGSLSGKKLLSKGTETYGAPSVFIIAEICMAVLMILMTFVHQYLLLLFLSFILGLFTRGTTPIVATLFITISHESHYARVYTIAEIFFGVAATISPILLGKTADAFNINVSFYIAACFAIAASAPIILFTKSEKRTIQ